MSFILDALRKSETERRQDSGPSITRIPDALPTRRLPVWAVATMGALGVAIVALTAAWWSAAGPGPGADTAAAEQTASRSARSEPLELPPATSPAPTSPVPTGPTPRRESQTAAGAPAPVESRGISRLREAAASSATPPAASAERPGESLPELDPVPDDYSAKASSLGLPPLTLELLAYSENPAQRFVFINGQRYAEGDTLEAGPRLIGITADGAVLESDGMQLQLTPR